LGAYENKPIFDEVVFILLFYQIFKINKTQILLKYFFGARGVKFLEKRRENVQIFNSLT
jgi:hypothetical protein